MSCIFTCYATIQTKFFEKNGIHDLIYGLHPKTLKPFWVYERNEKFNAVLKNGVKHLIFNL